MVPHTSAGVSRLHPTLPIFRLPDVDRAVFYTPGDALATRPELAAEIERALEEGPTASISEAHRLARTLEDRGQAAVRAWRELTERPFEPECLTLYLSNRCNLGCSYCYAAPRDDGRAQKRLRMYSGDMDGEFPILTEQVAFAAAQLVARNCVKKRKPLTLVLHGGGEPTLHWSLLERIRDRVEDIARDHGIQTWTYIATHGVLSEERARWLAAHFSLIGLSCDGPPDIQNANRPTAGGSPTSEIVERTARVFADAGAAYTVRATITRDNVRRQRQTLVYAHERLRARSVRFEPAYDGRRMSTTGFRPEDAEEFVEYFLSACELARELGCELQVSGIRLNEIHGPYCNPLRDVLQLTPDGVATACFLSTGSGEPEDAVMALGQFNPATGEFEVNQARAQALRARAARVPARCESCVNVYHCARDCPDVCVITVDPASEQHAGFRCRVQKALGQHRIREMAGGGQVG